MVKINSTSATKSIKHTYLTAKGLAEVRAELENLKRVKRAEIADRIHQAREYGDLTENSEYDSAMEDQSLNENRIAELEEILKDAKVIAAEHDNEFVVIGSTVKIEMDEDIDEFTIVGRVEANPAKKKISNESPLGSSLLGAKKGEEE